MNWLNHCSDASIPVATSLNELQLLLPWFGVSRMNRIDSSFQCCIKDGSRPTAYAVQTEYANHLKVLYSKDMVLNV